MNLLRFSTILISCFYTLSTSYISGAMMRVKRAGTNPKHSYQIDPDLKNTTDIGLSIDVSTHDVENISDLKQSNRIVPHSFTDTITITEDELDISRLSEEFLNCDHVSLESDEYEKLKNGSVFVPVYNILFDKSNYFIREGVLFLCPIFYKERDPENTTDVGISIDVSTHNRENIPDLKQSNRTAPYSFNDTATITEEELDISHLSAEFFNCTHISLESETYVKLNNGSVFVPMYHMSFDKSDYLIREGVLFLCPVFYKEFESTEKFSATISTVSILCVGISAVCIKLHMIMFILVKRLRNLPGYVLLSLCVALLAAYICSFIQYEVKEHMDCMVVGMFMLYFFLSSFFWMNTMSYDVWRSIRLATAKLRLTSDRPIMVRFARYSVYSWGMPLIIIISSIIVHNTSSNVKYRLIFDINTCWFAYKQALTTYFVIPLFSLLGLNLFFFISSFYMISMATMTKSASGTPGSDLWSRLFLSLRLSSVMGFMWIFGIIAMVTDREWLWYLYAVCNALQGVFIFFSFTVSKRTRKECKKAMQSRKCSVMPTQSSVQTSTQSQPTTAL